MVKIKTDVDKLLLHPTGIKKHLCLQKYIASKKIVFHIESHNCRNHGWIMYIEDDKKKYKLTIQNIKMSLAFRNRCVGLKFIYLKIQT